MESPLARHCFARIAETVCSTQRAEVGSRAAQLDLHLISKSKTHRSVQLWPVGLAEAPSQTPSTPHNLKKVLWILLPGWLSRTKLFFQRFSPFSWRCESRYTRNFDTIISKFGREIVKIMKEIWARSARNSGLGQRACGKCRLNAVRARHAPPRVVTGMTRRTRQSG